MGHTLHLGWPTVIESYADRSPFGVVFEDDGKLAYFYAVDTRAGDKVLDALCIYHITDVVNHRTAGLDAAHAYDVRIVWSADQRRVALLLDGEAHAAFDFERQRAYCRSNFPEGSNWSPGGHAWDDKAVDFLTAPTDETAQPATKYTMLSSLTS